VQSLGKNIRSGQIVYPNGLATRLAPASSTPVPSTWMPVACGGKPSCSAGSGTRRQSPLTVGDSRSWRWFLKRLGSPPGDWLFRPGNPNAVDCGKTPLAVCWETLTPVAYGGKLSCSAGSPTQWLPSCSGGLEAEVSSRASRQRSAWVSGDGTGAGRVPRVFLPTHLLLSTTPVVANHAKHG